MACRTCSSTSTAFSTAARRRTIGDSITDAEFVTRSPRLIDPAAMALLNKLLAATGAEIVVSSTWRHRETIASMQELLDSAGLRGRVVGLTPNPRDVAAWTCRGDEIAAWCSAQSVSDEEILILDDGADFGPLSPRVVKTDPEVGLTDEDVARSIALLRPARSPR